jgi:hypothetical protein
MSASLNTNSNKTAAFASYKTTVIHTVYCEARLNFMNCYLHGVHAGEIDYKLILFSDNDWFHLSGYLNSWQKRLPMLVHKVPFKGVWYVMCTMMIMRPILFLSHQIHTDMSLTFKRNFLNM